MNVLRCILVCALLVTVNIVTVNSGAVTINYVESDEDITNPDRGFYYPYTTNTSSFTALTENELVERRINAYTPFQANYTVKSSIALRHYVLDSFVNTNTLSDNFLDNVQADFNTAREAGVRLIIRFSYTITPVAGDCAAGFICPPYGDVSKQRVLAHINQLVPVLQSNSDVILGLQQGFIGTWGENYYSDHFGDPSVNGGVGYLTNQNWEDRNEVNAALLAALPVSRMLQVRYPQSKQRFLFGPNAPLSTAPLSSSNAFDQSDIARIGVHNDCFLASQDDLGTFADYGNNSSPVSQGNSATLKEYLSRDSRFTLVGGETCSDAYSPQNDCESVAGGQVLASLERYHYTYLNSDYNNEVNNDWQTGGCLSDIKKRLGYRYVLREADAPSNVSLAGSVAVRLEIENVGFAAAVNPRVLNLVLRHTVSNKYYSYPLVGANVNAQKWLAGEVSSVSARAVIGNIELGEYELLLHIADPSANGRVLERPEYSIQLANENLWEPASGFNKLNATIKVVAEDDDFLLRLLPSILPKRQAE